MNNSTSSATGEGPDMPKTTVKKVTRKDVEGPIWSALWAMCEVDRHRETSAKLVASLTPQKIKVLSPDTKAHLMHWAHRRGHHRCIQWLRCAPDDLESFAWEETVRTPEAKPQSPKDPLEEVFHVLEELSGKLNAEDKALFEAQIRTLRQIIELDEKGVGYFGEIVSYW